MRNYLFSKSRELNLEQWMNLADQYQESGLTQAGFCVRNGLAYPPSSTGTEKLRLIPCFGS